MNPDISKVIAPCDSNLIVVSDCRSIYHQFGIINIVLDASNKVIFDKLMKSAYKEFDLYLESFNHDDKYILLYFVDCRYWEISQKLSRRNIDSIYLPEKDKTGMIEDIKKFINPDTMLIYERLCITYKRVYLFEGIPGSGKTSFIKALASHFNYNLATLHFNTKMEDSDFLKILNNLPKKTFLLFEDMDCLFKNRKEHDTESNHVTLSGILNGLDGIGTKHGLICFITTNYKSHLDSALLRPGRVDKIIKFDYVNQEQVHDIYKAFMWECYTDDEFKKFYKSLSDLRVKVNVSILTLYLFGYYNNPIEALKNIELIKTSFNDSKIETTADDTDMYT
jgi:chaperone BCS1